MPVMKAVKSLRVPVSEELLQEEHRDALQQFCEKWYQLEAEYQGYTMVSGAIVALPADSNNTVAVQAWVQWFESPTSEVVTMYAYGTVDSDTDVLEANCKDEFRERFRDLGYRVEGDVTVAIVDEGNVQGMRTFAVSGRVRRTDLIENT